MKNRLMVVLIGLGLLLAATSVLAGPEKEPEALINHARTIVLGAETSCDAITEALVGVLDASLLILPKTDYAEEFRSRIGTVKQMFEDKVLFSDKGRQYLGLAYKLVNGGMAWQLPEELKAPDKSVEQALKICVKLLDSALAERKAGRNEQAVRYLIDFVIMVVTPVEA